MEVIRENVDKEKVPVNKNTRCCPYSPKSSPRCFPVSQVFLQETASEREKSTTIMPYIKTQSPWFFISILSTSKLNSHFN